MSRVLRALQSSDPDPQQPTRHSDGPDLLSQLQVCDRLGISDQTWLRWRKAGRTPEPVMLPSGRLKWRVEDIDALTRKPAPVPLSRYFGSARGPRWIPVEGR